MFDEKTAMETAPERNRRITQLLIDAGERIGLQAEREYPVIGGRIDVVWLWEGPPQFPPRLPLVGFEVESSWRSRKHIKGDLHNLVELQPALGVIVLLGEGEKVESVRRFARDMVGRRTTRVEVWSEDDIVALAEGRSERVDELLAEAGADVRATAEGAAEPVGHAGKYRRLAEWLVRQKGDQIEASFGQIEEILGFPLPDSSRNHQPHWHSYQGSAVARAIIDAGWRARSVNLTAERVTFIRDR